jgi:hypothetical protein
VDVRVLGRAVVAQGVAVGVLFALLVAAPLSSGFFRDFGWAVGPGAWLVAALVASRWIPLATALVIAAAAVSGLVAGGLSLAVSHAAGMVLGVLAFGLLCGGLAARAMRAWPGDPTSRRSRRAAPAGRR